METKQFNQFVESMKRLYGDGEASKSKISESKIVELYESKKITEEEKNYILGK